MALGLTRSPYEVEPPKPANAQAGLEYSRHYAKRIKDLGRNSKDTWIKRIWNHVFTKNNKNVELCVEPIPPSPRVSNTALPRVLETTATVNEATEKEDDVPVEDSDTYELVKSCSSTSTKEKAANAAKANQLKDAAQKPASVRLLERQKTLPLALANSPYITPMQRVHYKIDKQVELQKAYGGAPVAKEPKLPQPIKREQPITQTKVAQSYLPSITDSTRPRNLNKVTTAISIEKRAKTIAEKAMLNAKIFTCAGPYPVDAYVRFSLRKRGWVEKFGQHANANNSQILTDSKLECELDEDFEVICEQGVPAPWQEDHGIYAIMSRLVRHYPAKFIWGNRSVNNMTLRNEVVVNHFPKARSFSSKVGLTNSLKELPWLNSGDQMMFFPRCYLLGEEEKDDIIDDFQLTACMSLLKWAIYQSEHEPPAAPTINKSASGTSIQSASGDVVASSSATDASQTQSETQSRSYPQCENEAQEGLPPLIDREPTCDVVIHVEQENNDFWNAYVDCYQSSGLDRLDGTSNEDGATAEAQKRASAGSASPQPTAGDASPTKLEANRKVLPELGVAKNKQVGTVPEKAVIWALQHLSYFIKCKTHADIDTLKKPRAGRQHWKHLHQWCYEVAREGARVVDVSESTLKDCRDMLQQMVKYWPQLEMDSMRNIWIVKPGDKSKGIGIEFCDKLEDILKYTDNSTIQGTYVLQKYIEQPLLIHNVKFDIRQWFLVTEWNPLTVWIYEDCYLRICSQEYSHDTKHEAVHLSNVAIQQNYLNGSRSEKLPDNNYMDSRVFKQYLVSIGAGHAWDDIIYPGMKNAVINTLLATQDIAEHRKCAFELYGADFMLTEDFKPWLLEINSSPGMAPTSKEKAKLCAAVIDDTIKVVLDRKADKKQDTGGFELAFKDTPTPQFKCVETKLTVEGQRIRRFDLQRYSILDQKAALHAKERERKARERRERLGRESTQLDRAESTLGFATLEHGNGDGQSVVSGRAQEMRRSRSRCETPSHQMVVNYERKSAVTSNHQQQPPRKASGSPKYDEQRVVTPPRAQSRCRKAKEKLSEKKCPRRSASRLEKLPGPVVQQRAVSGRGDAPDMAVSGGSNEEDDAPWILLPLPVISSREATSDCTLDSVRDEHES